MVDITVYVGYRSSHCKILHVQLAPIYSSRMLVLYSMPAGIPTPTYVLRQVSGLRSPAVCVQASGNHSAVPCAQQLWLGHGQRLEIGSEALRCEVRERERNVRFEIHDSECRRRRCRNQEHFVSEASRLSSRFKWVFRVASVPPITRTHKSRSHG